MQRAQRARSAAGANSASTPALELCASCEQDLCRGCAPAAARPALEGTAPGRRLRRRRPRRNVRSGAADAAGCCPSSTRQSSCGLGNDDLDPLGKPPNRATARCTPHSTAPAPRQDRTRNPLQHLHLRCLGARLESAANAPKRGGRARGARIRPSPLRADQAAARGARPRARACAFERPQPPARALQLPQRSGQLASQLAAGPAPRPRVAACGAHRSGRRLHGPQALPARLPTRSKRAIVQQLPALGIIAPRPPASGAGGLVCSPAREPRAASCGDGAAPADRSAVLVAA